MTSSHVSIKSRRSLRPSASVEPANILDESGQSVPPSFYGDEPVQKGADDPQRSQHGLPEHLYGVYIAVFGIWRFTFVHSDRPVYPPFKISLGSGALFNL